MNVQGNPVMLRFATGQEEVNDLEFPSFIEIGKQITVEDRIFTTENMCREDFALSQADIAEMATERQTT